MWKTIIKVSNVGSLTLHLVQPPFETSEAVNTLCRSLLAQEIIIGLWRTS